MKSSAEATFQGFDDVRYTSVLVRTLKSGMTKLMDNYWVGSFVDSFEIMENNDLYYHDWINIDQNWVHKTAIVHPNVILGKGNVIGAYSVIGGNGEIRGKDWRDFRGKVTIGDNNVISEHVTIQRPFAADAVTVIGNQNIIMAHAHIGHDAQIGSNCEICSTSVIGGYAIIEDGAKVKLMSVIRNRKRVGAGAIVGMGAVVTKDVPKEDVVYGNPARSNSHSE